MFEGAFFYYVYRVNFSMLFDSVSDNGDTVSVLSQNNFGASEIQWLESSAFFLFIFKSAPCHCEEEMSA